MLIITLWMMTGLKTFSSKLPDMPPMLTVTAWPKPAVARTRVEIEHKLEQTLNRLHNCEEALSVERRKRRALEQQVLLDGSVQAGSSRRLKVTVSLAVIGCVFLSISVPVCVFQLFGLGNIEVDYGYAVSGSTLGCAIFLAGTTAADHRLVRFMAGFFAQNTGQQTNHRIHHRQRCCFAA